MKPEEQALPGEEILTRIASLREYNGSRDDLLRRFLVDAHSDDQIEDAFVLLRSDNGKVLHYYAGQGTMHRDELEETDQRPFGEGDLFTGGLPQSIRPKGDEIYAFPVRGREKLFGGLFIGLPSGSRDHSLYPRMKGYAAFLGVALDNITLLDEVRRESLIDHLTKIGNFRYAMEELQREIDRGRRFGSRFSILMIDLDRFKEFNDRYGHPAGNDALHKIAQLFRRSVRSVDTAAKYGGDEFFLILPGTDREGAALLGRRLLAGMGGISLGREFRVSASIGVATYPDDGEESRELIENADRALYRAKERGGSAVEA